MSIDKNKCNTKSVPLPANLVCKKRKEEMQNHSLNTTLSYPYIHIIKKQWGVLPKNLIRMLIPNLRLTMARSAT